MIKCLLITVNKYGIKNKMVGNVRKRIIVCFFKIAGYILHQALSKKSKLNKINSKIRASFDSIKETTKTTSLKFHCSLNIINQILK